MPSAGLSIVVTGVVGAVLWVLFVRPLLSRLAPLLVRWRALSLETARYVPAERALPTDSSLAEEMERCGLSWLGDRLLVHDGDAPKPVRWFRDGSGTVFGFTGTFVPERGPTRHVVAFMTATPQAFLSTVRGGPNVRLATVPGSHMTSLPAASPLESVLSRHRADAAASPGEACAVTDCDSAVALHDKGRARVARWRTAQPYDQLLDADLRNVFRGPYAGLRKIMRRRVVTLESVAASAAAP